MNSFRFVSLRFAKYSKPQAFGLLVARLDSRCNVHICYKKLVHSLLSVQAFHSSAHQETKSRILVTV